MAVAFGAVGTRFAGATNAVNNPAIAYPAGIAAGNMLLLVVTLKDNSFTASTPAGWASLLDISGGTAVTGIDVGTTRTFVFWREADGSETGSVTVTLSGTPSGHTGYIVRYTKGAATGWATPTATGGADTTHGTAWSATGAANLSLATGDLVVIGNGNDTDLTTAYTTPTLTATGATITTPTVRLAQGGSLSSNDSGCNLYDAPVTAGTSSAAPVHTLAAGPSACGETAFVRLREVTVIDLVVADAGQAQTSTTPTLVLAGDPGVVPWVRDARYGGTGGTNTSVNHSVPIPTCQVGDDLWASFTLNGGHSTVTDPAGWTRIFPTTITDDGFNTLLIYRMTATSTEVAGGTVLVTVATAVRSNSGSMAIVGADTALSPDGVVTTTTTGGATSVSHTVNASTDNSLIVSILALDSASEVPTPTAPLVQWWDPMESGVIGQGNAGAVVHRPTAGSASYGWTWTTSIVRKAWTASIRSLAGTNLAVSAASQAQSADTVALVVDLAVADAVQTQTSTTVALVVDLAVAAASQAQTADTVPLGVDLAVSPASQAQTSTTVALVILDLVVSAATQAQTSTTVALVVDLAVAAASQAQTADTVALVVDLAPASATQAHTAETVTLPGTFAVNDATQAQTSTSPTLVLAGDPGVVPWVRDARFGGTGGTNTSVNHSVPIPTCQVGDDLWASFTLNGGHGAVTDPSGWTRVFPTTITDDGFMTLLVYRKTATATEVAGGTVLVTVGTAVRGNSGSMAIVGADTAAAPDGVVTSTATTAATSLSLTVNASTDNSLILFILGLDSAFEDPTPTAPLVQWWDPMESGVIGQGNAGAVVHRPTAGSASYGWTWTASVARKGWAASLISAAPPINLVVSAASQAQSADTVSLVPDLAVSAASQAQTSTTVALVVDLVPASATQAQTADTVPLGTSLVVSPATQAQTSTTVALVVDLAVAAATQAHTADTVPLGVDLTVAAATQAQTADTVPLGANLPVSPATQAQTSTTVSLVVDLAVADATHAQSADIAAIWSGGIDIVLGSARQTQTADTVLLNGLAVAAASQAQTSTTVALVVDLVPAAATQTQTADTVPLVFGLSLTVSDPTQTHTSTDVTLTQLHQLAVESATQALESTFVVPTQLHLLAVDSASHAHTADLASITSVHHLAVSAASHAHASTAPTLTQFNPARASMHPTARTAPTMAAAKNITAPTMKPAGQTGPTMTGG